MAFFKESFLQARRRELLRSVQRFQYQINNKTWYEGEINDKEIVGENVIAFVSIPSSGESDTITAVRMYDNNGALAGEQTVSLKRSSLNTALIRFTFPLIEAK